MRPPRSSAAARSSRPSGAPPGRRARRAASTDSPKAQGPQRELRRLAAEALQNAHHRVRGAPCPHHDHRPPPRRRPQASTGRARASAAHDWKHIAEPPSSSGSTPAAAASRVGMAIETGALILVMGLLGFAPDAMGEPAIGSVSWALVSGTGLVFLTFVMAWAYARRRTSGRCWPPRRSSSAGGRAEPTRRFAR